MEIILDARGVNKVFGNRKNSFSALRDIDLKMVKGEFVAVMGPSGAGKSTLLNVLSTIEKPSSGVIMVDGQNVSGMSDKDLTEYRRGKMGFIFQDYNLLDTLTVEENILLPLAFSRKSPGEINNRVKDLAARFGIKEILDKYPYEISGGQQQRTAVCRAIVGNPSILFADEPTGALDSKSAYQLLETLSGLNQEKQSTILMVTHDAYAASFCSRVVFIKDGALFTEIRKGEQSRKQMFQQILNILSTLGGIQYDIV
ncbi:putative ABC transport system ATP-binding protein [Bacillus sp. SORGH_AS 510]|uniref:ABC transporter ATP-binding protein n=1 Tax=Bacillus sp. SORGH_AS_0510 TaxID=3041771 RepID=UPI0027850C3B|nr:ABC transporter ATP-binding protein [Bacillus sp. SORGH_AS_0510]MDQ1145917.1 putative ABC transport system ATP-binding protein [Bacillus sp. SORGH_AS_0510]